MRKQSYVPVGSVRSLLALAAAVTLSQTGLGQTLVSANFAGYADGQLVGQNSWLQYAATDARPLTLSGGAVTWAGGNTTDGQDAVLLFDSQISQPISGAAILHYDLQLKISNAGANPSYFAALNGLASTVTSGNFQNARLVAKSFEDGFQFGTRVNGQGGYPFTYGVSKLSYNTSYALRAEIYMIAGNANDYIHLFVGPDFENLSLYASAFYGSGTVTDPTYGGMLISQFGSASTQEAGVSISSMSVTLVPEPSSAALLGLAALCFGVTRRRQ